MDKCKCEIDKYNFEREYINNYTRREIYKCLKCKKIIKIIITKADGSCL